MKRRQQETQERKRKFKLKNVEILHFLESCQIFVHNLRFPLHFLVKFTDFLS